MWSFYWSMVLSVYLSMSLRVPEPKKPPFWGRFNSPENNANPPNQCQIWIAGILGIVCGPLSSYWDHAWFPSMALPISHHTSFSFTHSNARSILKIMPIIRYLLNTYVTLSPHFTIFMNASTVNLVASPPAFTTTPELDSMVPSLLPRISWYGNSSVFHSKLLQCLT